MRKKICAVLIGIRYPEGEGHLRGCHNDVINVFNYLRSLYQNNDNYEIDYIILADSELPLCDGYKNIWPTRNNIIKTLKDTIGKYKNYFIHYSGHGTSVMDWGGDEIDYKDEAMCPVDYSSQGLIKDDTLNKEFLQHLDSDCIVRILMDCCRSGTIWDLKYKYNNNGIGENEYAPLLNCNVIALSGCKDNQYSYDVHTEESYQGAFTYCFLKSIDNNIYTDDLINKINNNLKKGGWSSQTSKLTTSFKLSNKNKFLLFEKIEGESITELDTETFIEQDNNFDIGDLFNLCSIM